MSLNPNTRTKRIEMMVNPAEVALLDTTRGPVDRSSFLRGLMYAAARTHGTTQPSIKESRPCRGRGNPTSRGAGFQMTRRQV